jgi:non-homologous end joining protein Ku
MSAFSDIGRNCAHLDVRSYTINQKRSGKAITSKPRPKGENVVDLMDALGGS